MVLVKVVDIILKRIQPRNPLIVSVLKVRRIIKLLNLKSYLLGPQNTLQVTLGESLDVNPSGFDNCEKLSEFVKSAKLVFQ